MPSLVTNFNVVLTSPSDVANEREIVNVVIEKLREEFKNEGSTLTLYRWEKDVDPNFHPLGPQAQIDEALKISEADIFLAIFYKRAGTPVFDAISGSAHELCQAIEAWKEKRSPEIKLYFKKALTSIDDLSDTEIDDFKKIRDLKKLHYKSGVVQEFETTNEFEEAIERHLRNYLRKKSVSIVNEEVEPENNQVTDDLQKLIDLFQDEQNTIDYKSEKQQIEKVEDLKSRIYTELFSAFEEKKASLPNIQSNLARILFNKILVSHSLNSELINDLANVRHDSTKYCWYDRSLIVSALSLNLLVAPHFDTKAVHLLIDFFLDEEEHVWQRALSGLVLGLIKNQNKIGRFGDLVQRLKKLQGNPNFQNGIFLIEAILRERVYDFSIFPNTIYDHEFFKQDLANCFIPFYENNLVIVQALEKAEFDFDSENIISFLKSAPIANPVKYALCLSKDFGTTVKEKNVSPERIERFVRLLSVGSYFAPFQTIISEYYNFFKHYPQYSLDTFFAKKLFIGKSKVKDLILSVDQELKISARAHIEDQEYNAAVSKLERLIKRDAKDLEALWLLGNSYSQLFQTKEALETYLKFYELKSDDLDSILAISRCYSRLNDRKSAFKFLKIGEDIKATNIKVIEALIEYYINVKEIEVAESYFKRAFDLEPNNEEIEYQYAKLQESYYYEKNKARQFYEKVKDSTKNSDILSDYAVFIQRNELPDDPIKYFKKSLAIDNSAGNKTTYGRFLVEFKYNVKEGERMLFNLIRQHSSDPHVVAEYLYYQCSIQQDVVQYKKLKDHILKNFNDVAPLLSVLASYEKQFYPESPEILSLLQRSYQLNPFSTFTCSKLAMKLFENKDYENSEHYFRLVNKYDPYSGGDLTNFVSILCINGHYKEASEVLNKGLSLIKDKEDLLVMYFLSYAHLQDEEALADDESKINELLNAGVKSLGTDITLNVSVAISNGHANIDKLKKYALSITEKSEIVVEVQ